ncbi:MAG: glycosyl transferase family 2 [Pseudomonadota bacterium]
MTSVHMIQPARPDLAVLVATDAKGGVRETLEQCRSALDGLDLRYEVVVIVDGARRTQVEGLQTLAETWPQMTVIGQRPWNGEDAALAAAVRRSTAEKVMILPGWPQVDPTDLPLMIEGLGESDLVSAARTDRDGGAWHSFRGGAFARLLSRLFGAAPSDPFCRVHVARRDTIEDVAAFGTRQHFLPVIAGQRGHSVSEVSVRPAPAGEGPSNAYVFKPLGHFRALFDALTLYVVLTFLRRPLRFFGAIGLPIFLVGAIVTAILVAGRLLGETALSDRPLLIFAVMMVVLGVQIIAIGLVGEIIVFSNARKVKQYEVAEVISSGDRAGSITPLSRTADDAG